MTSSRSSRPARSTTCRWRSGRPASCCPPGYRLELLIEGKDFVHADAEQPDVYARLGNRMSELAGDGNDRANVFRGSGPAIHNDWVDRPADVFGGTNTIHTGGRYDSYVLLPVVPAR
jgi:predicted acyl esterase